jgi:hypothetical protein
VGGYLYEDRSLKREILVTLLFAFGVPLVASFIVVSYGVMATFITYGDLWGSIAQYAMLPIFIFFGSAFLFIPSFFVGIAASYLRFQKRGKNFIYLIVSTLCIGLIYYGVFRFHREDDAIMSFVLLLISSSIIGYFLFFKKRKPDQVS